MQNYYSASIKVLPVKQKNKEFYVGVLSFIDFENRYSTSPAKYKIENYKTISEDDDRYLDLIEEVYNNIKTNESSISKGFQRDIDPKRIEEIKAYITKDEYGIIPNSIIVSVDVIEPEDDKEFESLKQFKNDNKAILYKNELFIPNEGKPFLIIDGQHRVRGCEVVELEIKKDLQLIVSFITNSDPATQAQLFTTINYKVKPVNKSYLYQILGEFNIDVGEYTFLHEVVKVLNELPHSPLYDRVKMLGKKHSDKSSLSQAFLVESLYLLISPKYRSYDYLVESKELIKLPVFRYHYNNPGYRKEIIKFLFKYLKTIKTIAVKNGIEWDNKDQHIIFKTTGMGAILNIIPNVYALLIMKNKLLESQKDFTSKIAEEDWISVLNPIMNINLKNGNEFSTGSGRGLINKLSIKIWSEIVNENKEFTIFQKEYIDWFNKIFLSQESK